MQANVLKMKCMTCQVERDKESFSYDQWEKASSDEFKLSLFQKPQNTKSNTHPTGGTTIIIQCRICIAQEKAASLEKICSICSMIKAQDCYSRNQWKNSASDRKCRSCVLSSTEQEAMVCSICSTLKKKNEFSKSQWMKHPSDRRCRVCVQSLLKRTSHELLLHDRLKTSSLCADQAKVFDLKCYHYTPISFRDEKEMLSLVMEYGYYGQFPESHQTLKNLETYIDSPQTHMTMSQALSLRQHYLMQKAMQRHYMLKVHSQSILRYYNTGTSIVQLAKKLDLPPLNVLRQILSDMNYSKDKIKMCFKKPDESLPNRERRQFHEASAVDIIAAAEDDDRRLRAQAFEKEVETFLHHHGFTFHTEADLIKMDVISATPDVLLKDHLVISGRRINWIDAKGFYGSNIANIVSSLRKQKDKYTVRWGVGAVIFLNGFNESLIEKVPDCFLLDWKALQQSKITERATE